MTIVVPKSPGKSPGKSAARKAARGDCVTPRCVNPAAPNKSLCHKCRDRLWRARHPEHHLWNNLKKSARRRGVDFTLTLEEFQAFCARENFVARVGRGPDDATIDRRDPSLGYSINNLRVLTNAENGRLGGALAYSGHRLEGQAELAGMTSYNDGEHPFSC